MKELLADLQVATPRIKGFFAASKKEVVGGVSNATVVYAVAQCVETVGEKGCQDCLTFASTILPMQNDVFLVRLLGQLMLGVS